VCADVHTWRLPHSHTIILSHDNFVSESASVHAESRRNKLADICIMHVCMYIIYFV
jgi:hypothetical protein